MHDDDATKAQSDVLRGELHQAEAEKVQLKVDSFVFIAVDEQLAEELA